MAKNEKDYDDPTWEKAKRVGKKIFTESPSYDISDALRAPLKPVTNVFRWILFGLGIILGVSILVVAVIFSYNVYTTGSGESLYATLSDSFSKVPGVSYLIPKFREASTVITDPSQAIIKTSNNEWKASVDATETDKELGLNFIRKPYSTSSLYFTDEKILIDADLAIKIPQEEEDETSIVSFGCLGESNGEVKEGVVVPVKKEIVKGEQ